MAEVIAEKKPRKTEVKKTKWELLVGAGGSFHACAVCGEVAPDLNERGSMCARKFCPGCGLPAED